MFGGAYLLFDLFAIAVDLKFWHKLLLWMFDITSVYWNVVWLFFVLLGAFSFVVGCKLLLERGKAAPALQGTWGDSGMEE